LFDVVYGEYSNELAVSALVGIIEQMKLTGTLYIGYPVLPSSAGGRRIDALLTCREHGIVAFDLSAHPRDPTEDASEWLHEIVETHADIYVALNNKFSEIAELRVRRHLAFEINTVTLLSEYEGSPQFEDSYIASPESLSQIIERFVALDDEFVLPINAAVQRTTTIKPRKKRTSVRRPRSRGSVIKYIESQIANLDEWQKKAAIELPHGPQRIRGLAGSGKTIVLAQKAAYLHAMNPEWVIGVTFHTRSLYQQFRDLIIRFSFEQTRDEPDWEYLKIMHTWGGAGSVGVYSYIAEVAGIGARDFSYARSKFSRNRAFEGVCRELLAAIKRQPVEPFFDVMLIDEAQDIPRDFFELVYLVTKSPKRIIWAYDELQNLSDYSMVSPEALFGEDARGRPQVSLMNRANRPREDIVLPVCYRNTPWALTEAHALGFGIYREDGLVQLFENASLWEDIGYEVQHGQLVPGRRVVLKRRDDATPDFFRKKIKDHDAIAWNVFESQQEEVSWLVGSIKKNISRDELELDDILIIVANPLRIRSMGAKIMSALKEKGINAHLAGVTASVDILFIQESVAISSIFRAKGNEAPMVYVVGAQDCYSSMFGLSRKRNILFTAITRSRAWVRVSGVGQEMRDLAAEAQRTVESRYLLDFPYPTSDEIAQLRTVHRDRSAAERKEIEKDMAGLSRLLQRIETGEISSSNLPEDLRRKAEELLWGDLDNDT